MSEVVMFKKQFYIVFKEHLFIIFAQLAWLVLTDGYLSLC
jgi:hypothetical protein